MLSRLAPRHLLGIFFIINLFPASILAQPLPPGSPANANLSTSGLAKITAYFEEYSASEQIPGVSFAIARNGKLVYTQHIGYQDIETQVPITDTTIFRIASMTKIVTSVAVLQLLEAGHFNLDDPVSDYIPEIGGMQVLLDPTNPDGPTKPAARAMTIRDLLMHTSGLASAGRSGINGRYGSIAGNPTMTLQEKMEAFGKLPLLYQPGTQWRYSMATTVLGYLVEVVSGKPFADYLGEAVFVPLGMTDTGFFVPEHKQHRVMSIYNANEEKATRIQAGLAPRETRLPAAPNGSGGLFSTVPDYLRFAQLLLNGGHLDGTQLLQPATVELMTRNHLPEGITLPERFGRNYGLAGYGFGLGVRVRTDVARSILPGNVGEYGWGGLFETYVLIDPEASLVALYMTQVRPSSFHPFRRDFTRMVYEALID